MFKAKAALITGSTSGIGLGMVETLAKKDCNIMLNGLGNRTKAFYALLDFTIKGALS